MQIIEIDGYAIKLDDEDYTCLSHHKWRILYGLSRGLERIHYVVRRGDPPNWQTTYLHREVMNAFDGVEVDHIDGNPFNNVKSNLRLCTRQENAQNARKVRGKSKYKGVSLHKQTGRWQAQIQVNGKRKHLGLYSTELAAYNVYKKAAQIVFGEFVQS